MAVIADNTWAAMEGRRKLVVQWDEGKVAAHSTADITKSFADAVAAGGVAPHTHGGRCDGGAGVVVEEDRRGVSDAVPGARSHGAAELHRVGAA